jgi:hypothetical protein
LLTKGLLKSCALTTARHLSLNPPLVLLKPRLKLLLSYTWCISPSSALEHGHNVVLNLTALSLSRVRDLWTLKPTDIPSSVFFCLI